LTPAERAQRREGRDKLQNDARTTLLQGLAALLVLTGAGVGAAVTLRQIRIGREQLAHTREQIELTRSQIAVIQEGQITERFTRAIDQLGSETRDVRLGGIYALERITRDSPNDQATIVEVLSAFVREHAADRPLYHAQDLKETATRQAPPASTADVRASLTVLGRRPDLTARPDLKRISLVGANLRGFKFEGFDLDGADMHGANLEDANLRDASLRYADLRRVHANNAIFEDAMLLDTLLEGAKLWNANFTNAYLWATDLRNASLLRANLQRATLEGAKLEGADFNGADLRGATLPPSAERMLR
jgi:uncharacterized protein YjbI with pentapeptide repeats